MRNVCFILATATSIVLGPIAGHANDVRDFLGLFEGVDPGDGSLTHRQITCAPGGSCKVFGSDSFFSFCAAADGRGLLEGDGDDQDGVLVVLGFTLTCANGDSISIDTRFTPDPSNGTIVEQTASRAIPPITFHRVSLPARYR